MPFENLENIILTIQLNPDVGSTLSNACTECRTQIELIVKTKNENKFLQIYEKFADILHWLKQNDPSSYSILFPQILADIPAKFHPFMFDALYTKELEALDTNNLTLERLAQITDVNHVGTGNVLIDLAIRNWYFARNIDNPEIITQVVALIPAMMQMINGIRPHNPFKFEDRYEHDKFNFVSPFHPCVTFSMLDTNNKHYVAVHKLALLVQNKLVAIEICQNALLEEPNADNTPGFWQTLIVNNYAANQQEAYFAPAKAEHEFLLQVEEHRAANRADPLGHLKFVLTLARNVYNSQNQVSLHFNFTINLLTSSMAQQHEYYLAETKLTNNTEIHPLIRAKLSLADDAAGNSEFAEFLEQLSIDAPKKSRRRSPSP